MPITDDLSILWAAVKDAITDTYPKSTVDLWFSCFTLTAYDGQSATLTTDNEFKFNIVKSSYFHELKRNFERVNGYPIEVNLVCTAVSEEEEEIEEELLAGGDASDETAAVRRKTPGDRRVRTRSRGRDC